jgi:hypothetical protein
MKKTIFTFCSIAVVCCAIFFACAKDDNSITHVTYVSQTSSSGTGGNPNPNGVPSNSGYGTTTATTAATTTSGTTTAPTNTTSTNFNVDGTAASSPTASGSGSSGSYIVLSMDNTGYPQVQITFPGTSAPASGSYSIITGTPNANQCDFLLTTAAGVFSSALGGSVTVTAGAPNTVVFSNILCGSKRVSGAIKY